MRPIIIAIFLCFLPVIGHANNYEIDKDKSIIRFSGTHAGNPFQGQFNEWSAQIYFDDHDLKASTAQFIINTSSATTGNLMYDGTLPTADWFDTNTYPTLAFVASGFDKIDDQYTVTGDLTIKGITNPVTVNFDLSGDAIRTVTARFPIDRMAYGIGIDSDPDAEWVEQMIQVEINLVTVAMDN